jgi:ATP-binding cassette subfamily F protein 3
MSLAAALKISLTFSQKRLFHEIGFQVEPSDRIGLVGPNGSGKTTLLRLLTGEISPDDGEIRVAEGIRLGYLPQDVHETLQGTLLQSIIDSVPGRVSLRMEATKIEQALSANHAKKEQEKLALRLAEIHQRMADLDKGFPAYGAEKILVGLGFKPIEFNQPIASFSGGWKMRAALGSLLYQNPDLLLLDEPTNHLDIPSIRWLEQFLQDYGGALMLVCHDRDFLNRQINRVISFEPEGLRSYSGNYDFYLKARQEERKSLEAKAKKQEQKIREAKKFIERFRAKASKARQAQSKIKLIKKMELVKSYEKVKTIHFTFPEVPRSGKVPVAFQGVSKGYDGKTLYTGLDLTVQRGERIAIIGPNGSGKTTLLRLVSGETHPDEGQISIGHGVTMSYYAQHHSEMLDPTKTIIEEVFQVVPHETLGFVRGVCGAFLFSGEDVDKAIGVLSGGERARVCLAKILVNPGNLLVMDEPTNHLDIISSEILIDALAAYQGTLLFVSHNQAFINRIATKIWDITEKDIWEYPGTLDEYYHHLSKSVGPSAETPELDTQITVAKDQETSQKGRPTQKLRRQQKAEKRRIINEALKPIREALSHLEERINVLETREKDLEKMLAEPDIIGDKGRYLPLLNEYNQVKEELEALMLQWEEKQKELGSTKRDLKM